MVSTLLCGFLAVFFTHCSTRFAKGLDYSICPQCVDWITLSDLAVALVAVLIVVCVSHYLLLCSGQQFLNLTAWSLVVSHLWVWFPYPQVTMTLVGLIGLSSTMVIVPPMLSSFIIMTTSHLVVFGISMICPFVLS